MLFHGAAGQSYYVEIDVDPIKPSRREVMKAATIGGSALLAGVTSQSAVSAAPHVKQRLEPGSIPANMLSAQFDVKPGIINLEAGYWSMMPRVVAEEYARNILEVNRANSLYARNVLPSESGLATARAAAKAAVARQVGCEPDEIAIARSGSDALQMLIINYRLLKRGDAIIHCDLDYDTTIDAMHWLEAHRGAKRVQFAIPEPATTANILDAYEDVLKRTPDAKLLLVTQVSHRTGLVTPVREIVAMARARGVDTIVDAAHGIALLDYQLDDLGADFVGWSVHKWTSAPLGTGALYIRRDRLADIEVAFNNTYFDESEIDARVPDGTIDFAALSTIPTAVDFHFAVGAAAKERHMRALRDRWVDAVRELPGVTMAVPDDPARYCAITSFRIAGMNTDERARTLQRALLEKHRIHTVRRGGIAGGPAIRVTPGLYSTPEDVDALAAAIKAEHLLFA